MEQYFGRSSDQSVFWDCEATICLIFGPQILFCRPCIIVELFLAECGEESSRILWNVNLQTPGILENSWYGLELIISRRLTRPAENVEKRERTEEEDFRRKMRKFRNGDCRDGEATGRWNLEKSKNYLRKNIFPNPNSQPNFTPTSQHFAEFGHNLKMAQTIHRLTVNRDQLVARLRIKIKGKHHSILSSSWIEVYKKVCFRLSYKRKNYFF